MIVLIGIIALGYILVSQGYLAQIYISGQPAKVYVGNPIDVSGVCTQDCKDALAANSVDWRITSNYKGFFNAPCFNGVDQSSTLSETIWGLPAIKDTMIAQISGSCDVTFNVFIVGEPTGKIVWSEKTSLNVVRLEKECVTLGSKRCTPDISGAYDICSEYTGINYEKWYWRFGGFCLSNQKCTSGECVFENVPTTTTIPTTTTTTTVPNIIIPPIPITTTTQYVPQTTTTTQYVPQEKQDYTIPIIIVVLLIILVGTLTYLKSRR